MARNGLRHGQARERQRVYTRCLAPAETSTRLLRLSRVRPPIMLSLPS